MSDHHAIPLPALLVWKRPYALRRRCPEPRRIKLSHLLTMTPQGLRRQGTAEDRRERVRLEHRVQRRHRRGPGGPDLQQPLVGAQHHFTIFTIETKQQPPILFGHVEGRRSTLNIYPLLRLHHNTTKTQKQYPMVVNTETEFID